MLTVRYARGLCGLLSPSTLLRRQGLPSTTNRLTSPPVTASITATTHLCNPPARAPFSNTAPALKKKKKVYLPVPESFLKYVKAPQNHLGTRIDRLCLRYFNVKTAKAQLMIKVGHIKVFRSSTPDDPSTYEHMKHATHRTALAANMILQVPKNFLEDPFGIHAVSKPRRHTLIDTSSVDHIIPIMYASQGLLVLNKPQGLASQGGTRIFKSVDSLLPKLRLGYNDVPRLLHRLDKETSGLMIVGRTAGAAARMAQAFREGKVHKYYLAVLEGQLNMEAGATRVITSDVGEIRDMHGESMASGQRLRQSANATNIQEATTKVTVIHHVMRNDKVFTFVRLEPLTGRKHQLRVHCADVLGIAIVNDPKYARCAPERLLQPRAKDGSHMCLHLAYLRFPVMNRQGNAHPDEKQEASVIAPMPLHLAKFANGIALDKLLPEHVLGEISKKRPKFVSEEARVAKDQANEEEGEKVEETPTDGEEASKTTKDDRKVKPYVTPFLRGLSKPRYFDDWA